MKAKAFSLFVSAVGVADELKKRGWAEKAADNTAAFIFKVEPFVWKLVALI